MKQLSKFVFPIFALAISFALVGCGEKPNTESQGQATPMASTDSAAPAQAPESSLNDNAAKLLMLADVGEKRAYKCRLDERFYFKGKVAVLNGIPELGIEVISEGTVLLKASSPEKASAILVATKTIGAEWQPSLCTAV